MDRKDKANSKLTARPGAANAEILMGLAFCCGALLYKIPGWIKSYSDGYKAGHGDDGSFLARDFLNHPFIFQEGYSSGLKSREKEGGEKRETQIHDKIAGFKDGYNVSHYFNGGGLSARDFVKLPYLTQFGYWMGAPKRQR
ncbi:MAG: hypothetical protein FWF01_01720 [Alphaproteobacteria bacterium]|nr:hypothetical protein [Alphaproteobacteria bacterium]